MATPRPIRPIAAAALLAAALAPLGCGSGDGSGGAALTGPPEPTPAQAAEPPAPAAGSGAPSTQPQGELSQTDREAVTATTRDYLAALNAHDGAAVCALLEPGAIDAIKLPATGSDCASSLEASIGHRHPDGTPRWRRTKLEEVTAVSVGEDRARVTATVVHLFSDRNYPSIEEDVVYLGRNGADGEWRLVKPSGSLYRAVGYPEPPIRAFTPP